MKPEMESKNTGDKDANEEVDDYMSNDFLDEIVDTRPGLVFSHAQARRNELDKKHKANLAKSHQANLQTSSKHLEKVNREEALQKSLLTEDNKGLNLMKKMGYKTGESLGLKSGSNITEPISVEIKLDRGGIGQAEEKKRKLEKLDGMRKNVYRDRAANERMVAESYVDNKRRKFMLRKLVGDLHKCQKVCYQLDTDVQNLEEPVEKWYWPINIRRTLKKVVTKEEPEQNIQKSEIDSDSGTEMVESSKPIELVEAASSPQDYYAKIINADGGTGRPQIDLQKAYDERLKVFISIAEDERAPDEVYDDCGDGDGDEANVYSAKFSAKVQNEKESDQDLDSDEETELDNEEALHKKIEFICLYLKETYFYCVWCAAKYEDKVDFESNCPGPTEDDHE